VLIIVIEQVADELANVNYSNTLTVEFEFKKSNHPSIWLFSKFYNDLIQTIRKESRDTPNSQTNTPQGQTTVPPNPRHPSPSTESTSSLDSKAEHFTHAAANDFLWATFDTIGVKEYPWYPKIYRIHHAPFSSSRDVADLLVWNKK